jgi:hypothetical protein
LIHFADVATEAMMVCQPGFFDLSNRYEALSAAGDPLERLSAVVDFEVFRGPLVAALRRSVRAKGGRPRDCQDFRVRAGIMGKKESHYVPTQGAGDPG